jgi:hypothetical protein
MKSIIREALSLLLVLSVGSALAAAHSPVDPEDGESLGTATHVEDPAKSWAIYGHLEEEGDTWYFDLNLDAGDRLYLSLLSTERTFVPTLVVMGPGLGEDGAIPAGLDVPEGAGWSVVEGEKTEAEFEPFTPGSYYHVAKYDGEVSEGGTYYVAVHSYEGDGPFSLAVGYVESFTIGEWLYLPASLLGIYHWEGQSVALILGPAIVVIAVMLGAVFWQHRKEEDDLTTFQWTSAFSGIFILAWAGIVMSQMAMALGKSGLEASAIVTLVFAGASFGMGIYAVRPAFKGPRVPDGGRRAGMVMVGVLALVLYSGFYLGPLMAFVAALLPEDLAGGRNTSERGSS